MASVDILTLLVIMGIGGTMDFISLKFNGWLFSAIAGTIGLYALAELISAGSLTFNNAAANALDWNLFVIVMVIFTTMCFAITMRLYRGDNKG